MDDIKALLAELDERQKKSARRSARFRRNTTRHLDAMHTSVGDMQEAVGRMGGSFTKMQAALTTMQASLTTVQASLTTVHAALTSVEGDVRSVSDSLKGTDQSILGLRSDVDQLEAGHQKNEQDIGRVAQAVNTFVDGYELRFERLEERVTRLEQKSA